MCLSKDVCRNVPSHSVCNSSTVERSHIISSHRRVWTFIHRAVYSSKEGAALWDTGGLTNMA